LRTAVQTTPATSGILDASGWDLLFGRSR